MSASSVSMSEATWRLLIDPPASGAWNMAVDETLLDGVAVGSSSPTLRFYRWAPPCLSLGYFQPLSVVDVEACRWMGVDIVRRPTGGRAILHELELTYSVALPTTILGEEWGVLPSYERLSHALLAGLRLLGVPAWLAPESSAEGHPSHGPACFDRPSAHEILLGGRKLVGSAQLRRANAILQHGSILIDPQVEKLAACLKLRDADNPLDGLQTGVAGLAEVGHYEPEEIASAIASGFSQNFGARLEPRPLQAGELASATRLQSKYGSAGWTERKPAGSPIDTTRTR